MTFWFSGGGCSIDDRMLDRLVEDLGVGVREQIGEHTVGEGRDSRGDRPGSPLGARSASCLARASRVGRCGPLRGLHRAGDIDHEHGLGVGPDPGRWSSSGAPAGRPRARAAPGRKRAPPRGRADAAGGGAARPSTPAGPPEPRGPQARLRASGTTAASATSPPAGVRNTSEARRPAPGGINTLPGWPPPAPL